MSDSAPGFAQFVPGFDFLQSLAKGASSGLPQMPSLANWVAPTLNAEELDKRITELKAVHFWLEQNTRALSATIQALEVQKLTLATLHGMNVGLGVVASAFKFPSADAPTPPAGAVRPPAAAPAPEPEPQAAERTRARRARPSREAEATPAMVDPLKLWGALTQQFQEIANAALKDVAKASAAVDTAHQAAPASAAPTTPSARRVRARAPATGAPARAPRKTDSSRKRTG